MARYRWIYELKRTPDSANDYTNVYALIDTANVPTNNPAYYANLEELVDTEEWMRMSAIQHATGDLDGIFTEVQWNMYSYKPTQGKWTVLKWDWNITLGNSSSWGPNGNNLFSFPSADPSLLAFQSYPPYRRAYLRAFNDIANGPMNNANVNPMLDAKYAAFVANGIGVSSPAALETWIGTMHNSLLAALAAQGATNAAFTVTGTNFITTNSNFISLSGTAPVQVKTIAINGQAYPVTWTSPLNWTITVPVHPSTNALALQGYDLKGNILSNFAATVTVNDTGAAPDPVGALVINEIMYQATMPGAEYVELYNNSTNLSFDLSGWLFQGLGYTFPAGSLLGPGGFLVLAADPVAFTEAYGATNDVFDTFPGSLQPGQLLALIQPGSNGSSNTVVAELRFDSVPPWPTNANGTGSSLQLIDPRQDNWRVGNWAVNASAGRGASPDQTNTVAAVLTPFAPLWLNEVEPDNLTGLTNSAGQHAPWIELYNPSTNSVSLRGLYLANNYTDLAQWPFPTNAVIGARQFLVVFADGLTNLSTTNELHAGFVLPTTSGSLALSRFATNAQAQVLDYLDYANLPANCSYGSFPDGQSFVRQVFYQPTPGATNTGSGSPPPSFIPYWVAGSTYAQNFDSLPDPGAASVNADNPVTINGVMYSLANPYDLAFPASASGNNGGLGISSLAGWYGLADPTASVGTRFGATDGDQTTGGQISFGLPNSSNRALGLLATSTTGYTAFGARFFNATSQTLRFITLQFTGEVWRQSNLGKTLEFYYFVDPTGTNAFSTSATAFLPALNVSFPTVPADVGGAPVDGTAAVNQTNLAVFNQVIADWNPGAALWLVWEMASPAGKSQGLAIDNLSFSASAWPTGMSPPPLLAQANGTNLVLSCATLAGLNYQLEYKSSLSSAPWTALGSLVPGTGNPFTFTNSFNLSTQGFYRLVILP